MGVCVFVCLSLLAASSPSYFHSPHSLNVTRKWARDGVTRDVTSADDVTVRSVAAA